VLRLALGAVIALVAGMGARAEAQSCVDRAVADLRRADFAAARAALERCESATGLTPAELALYYETSALLSLAAGDDDAGTLALSRLAAIAPDHAFSDDAPPSVRSRFAEIAGRAARPSLEVSAEPDGDEVVIVAAVRDDPHSVVRQTHIFVRSGGAPWSDRVADRVTAPAPAGSEVAYYAVGEAIGGAEVVRAGSADAPLTFRAPSEATEAPPPPSGGDNTVLHIVLVTAAIVLVGASVAIGVAVATSPKDTQLGSPIGMGFGL
jgi:hypothetical protein